MRFRTLLEAASVFGACAFAAPLTGQTPAPAVPGPVAVNRPAGADSAGPILTLAEAQSLAQRNNPSYLQTIAARRSAGAATRAAWGQLLPQATAQLIGGYRPGQVFFSGSALGSSSDAVESQWSLGLTYQLSAATLLTPPSPARRNVPPRPMSPAHPPRSRATSQCSMSRSSRTRPGRRCRIRWSPTRGAGDISHGREWPWAARRRSISAGRSRAGPAAGPGAAGAQPGRDREAAPLSAAGRAAAGRRASRWTRLSVAPPAFTLDSVLALARRDNPQVNALRARENAAGVGVHGPTVCTRRRCSSAPGWVATPISTRTRISGRSAQRQSVGEVQLLPVPRHARTSRSGAGPELRRRDADPRAGAADPGRQQTISVQVPRNIPRAALRRRLAPDLRRVLARAAGGAGAGGSGRAHVQRAGAGAAAHGQRHQRVLRL